MEKKKEKTLAVSHHHLANSQVLIREWHGYCKIPKSKTSTKIIIKNSGLAHQAKPTVLKSALDTFQAAAHKIVSKSNEHILLH